MLCLPACLMQGSTLVAQVAAGFCQSAGVFHWHGTGCVQERQRRGEDWTPRWFTPAADTTVHAGEATQEQCPMFDFTGAYLKTHLQTRALSPSGAATPAAFVSFAAARFLYNLVAHAMQPLTSSWCCDLKQM